MAKKPSNQDKLAEKIVNAGGTIVGSPEELIATLEAPEKGSGSPVAGPETNGTAEAPTEAPKGKGKGKGAARPARRENVPKLGPKSAVAQAVEAEAADNGKTLEELNGEIAEDSKLDPETEPESGPSSPVGEFLKGDAPQGAKGKKKGPKGAVGSVKGKGKKAEKKPKPEPKRRGRPPGSGKGTALDRPADQPLTPVEFDRYQTLNAIIKQGLDGFIEVGAALAEVRSARLYRDKYKTFAEYCEQEQGVSERIANYSIGGSRVLKGLESAGVENLPTNRTQTRHLIGVPEDKLVEAWKGATDLARAEGKEAPEERHVKESADKVLGKTPKSPSTPAEPRDVQAGRKSGAIPQGATVAVRDEGEADDFDEEPVDTETPDIDWLAKFDAPIRGALAAECKEIFDRDALDYRWIASHRVDFIGDIKRLCGNLKKSGPYISALLYRLRRPDPSQWKVCPTCNGKGVATVLGNSAPCTDCRRNNQSPGYKVP